MTAEQFVYWLQGFMELGFIGRPEEDVYMTPEQVQTVKDHLALVFVKKTPVRDKVSSGLKSEVSLTHGQTGHVDDLKTETVSNTTGWVGTCGSVGLSI